MKKQQELSNNPIDWLKAFSICYWFISVLLYFSNSNKEAYFTMFIIITTSCFIGYIIFGIINFIIEIL